MSRASGDWSGSSGNTSSIVKPFSRESRHRQAPVKNVKPVGWNGWIYGLVQYGLEGWIGCINRPKAFGLNLIC